MWYCIFSGYKSQENYHALSCLKEMKNFRVPISIGKARVTGLSKLLRYPSV